MSYLFNTFLYYPLLNALILVYNYATFGDLGVAIIILTVLIRIVLFPLFYKSFEHQTIMQKLQPALQQIQHEHKEDKEKQALKMMELYKEHKVNPDFIAEHLTEAIELILRTNPERDKY